MTPTLKLERGRSNQHELQKRIYNNYDTNSNIVWSNFFIVSKFNQFQNLRFHY